MAIVATSVAVAFEQIHGISMRAVLGGSVLLVCCLIVAGLFKNKPAYNRTIFVVIIGTIALVSGILLAGALYVTQNPTALIDWELSQ
jgi:uncharacterized membrane protein HdeD (DUF308 family)